jgi:hypothetical protein
MNVKYLWRRIDNFWTNLPNLSKRGSEVGTSQGLALPTSSGSCPQL